MARRGETRKSMSREQAERVKAAENADPAVQRRRDESAELARQATEKFWGKR